MLRLLTICLLILLPGEIACAASSKITTRDGSVITGEVQSLKNGVYTLISPFGPVNIPAASVKSIEPLEGGAPISQAGAPSSHAGLVEGPLRLAGSNTIGEELMPALLEAYAASKGAPNTEWLQEEPDEQALKGTGPNGANFAAHLSRKGSATAFSALLKADADIGMASRRVKKEERDALLAAGFGDAFLPGRENVLALDGLVVIVNAKNPVHELTLEQIAGIFSGQITDWAQVGGVANPIHIYARDSKSGTYDTFVNLVLKDKKLSPEAKRFESNGELSDSVSADPDGIGFTGFAYVRNAKAISIGTDCGMSFPPGEFLVRTEEYPLARRLFLYTPESPTNRESANFTNFALSSQGQAIVGQKNFVNLDPELAGSGYGQNRVALAMALFAKEQRNIDSFAKIAATGTRLSVTFRFQTGSDELDSRAVRDLDRLAEFLHSSVAAGRKVAVLGFTDNRGSDIRNQRLSQDRAAAVANILRQKGIKVDLVGGLARTAPVACNTSPEGLEKNRRVEVWLQ